MFKTLYVLIPHTNKAKVWIKDHVQYEPWQVSGSDIVIEHRYINDVVEGMVRDGLRLNIDFSVE